VEDSLQVRDADLLCAVSFLPGLACPAHNSQFFRLVPRLTALVFLQQSHQQVTCSRGVKLTADVSIVDAAKDKFDLIALPVRQSISSGWPKSIGAVQPAAPHPCWFVPVSSHN